MCDVAAASLVVGLLSTAYTVKTSSDAAGAAEAQARENERQAGLAAQDAIERGRDEASQRRMASVRLRSAQRAALASSGFEADSGSAVDLQAETSLIGELDALTIENNAFREAYNLRAQGRQFSAQGQLAGKQRRAAIGAGLLTGGAQAIDFRVGQGGWFTGNKKGKG